MNAKGQSSLAVRCKMLVLGAGDSSPIPTGPGQPDLCYWSSHDMGMVRLGGMR